MFPRSVTDRNYTTQLPTSAPSACRFGYVLFDLDGLRFHTGLVRLRFGAPDAARPRRVKKEKRVLARTHWKHRLTINAKTRRLLTRTGLKEFAPSAKCGIRAKCPANANGPFPDVEGDKGCEGPPARSGSPPTRSRPGRGRFVHRVLCWWPDPLRKGRSTSPEERPAAGRNTVLLPRYHPALGPLAVDSLGSYSYPSLRLKFCFHPILKNFRETITRYLK
jgi:hypothetical protein